MALYIHTIHNSLNLSFHEPFHEWTTSLHRHRKEIASICLKLATEATSVALQTAAPTLSTLVSVMCMTTRRHPLTVADVFTVFALMSTLSETALKTIRFAVQHSADAVVTVKRTEAFLLGNGGEDSSPARKFGERHLTEHEGKNRTTKRVCPLK